MSIKSEENSGKIRCKINHRSTFVQHAKIRVKFDPILRMSATKKFSIVKNSDNPFDKLNELMNAF